MARRTGHKYKDIIDSAVRVIAEYGYHNAKVSEIAKEASVADGTIYLYFKNKDDILVSLFKEKMGSFITQMEDELKHLDSPIAMLQKLIKVHFGYLETYKTLAMVTQFELRQTNLQIRQGIGKTLKKYFNIIDKIILLGIENGNFREDLDVRITRKMIFGTIDEVVTSWIVDSYKYSIVSQADIVHSLLINAVRKN